MSGHAKAAGGDIRSAKKWHITGKWLGKNNNGVTCVNEAELLVVVVGEQM